MSKPLPTVYLARHGDIFGDLKIEHAHHGKIGAIFGFDFHLANQLFDFMQLVIRAAFGGQCCQFWFQNAACFGQGHMQTGTYLLEMAG